MEVAAGVDVPVGGVVGGRFPPPCPKATGGGPGMANVPKSV